MAVNQGGLSLVELMVAIAIASFIALAGTTLYVTTVGAGKELYDEASQTEQVFAITSALSGDIRRAGYRGNPTALSTYLVTTRGSTGVAGDEGDYPAVEFSTTGAPTAAGNTSDCVLVQYLRKHTCASSDEAITACDTNTDGTVDTVGAVVSVHHRFGYRLVSGVMEGVAVIHPSEYDSAPSTDSACNATGASSGWSALTVANSLYVDEFEVEVLGQTIIDADNNCPLGVNGASPCDSHASYSNPLGLDCGNTVSCRVQRLYKITICAYPGSTDGECVPAAGGSQPENQIYVEVLASPRNDALIAKAY